MSEIEFNGKVELVEKIGDNYHRVEVGNLTDDNPHMHIYFFVAYYGEPVFQNGDRVKLTITKEEKNDV